MLTRFETHLPDLRVRTNCFAWGDIGMTISVYQEHARTLRARYDAGRKAYREQHPAIDFRRNDE